MTDEERLIEGRALVESGDLKLGEYREKFALACGRPCKLTDDQLIAVCMAPDDDQDEADWIKDMLAAEEKLESVTA